MDSGLAAKYLSMVQDESLDEHDKKYHPKGYKDGDRCKVRGKAGKDDSSDRISDAVGLMNGWIEGLKVNFVDAESIDVDPSNTDVRMMALGGFEDFIKSEADKYLKTLDGRYHIRVDRSPFSPIASDLAKQAGVPVDKIKNAPVILYARMFHGLLPIGDWPQHNGRVIHGHGATQEQLVNAIKRLQDGGIVMTIPDMVDQSAKKVVAIIKSPYGDVNDTGDNGFSEYTVMAFYYNDTKQAMNEFDRPFVTVLTAFPANRYFCGKIRDLAQKGMRSISGNREMSAEFFGYLKDLSNEKSGGSSKNSSSHAGSNTCVGRRKDDSSANPTDGGILSKSDSVGNGILEELAKKYLANYFAGRYEEAYENMSDYAALLPEKWAVKKNKRGDTEFISTCGGQIKKKSDAFEFDGKGRLLDLSERFRTDIPIGNEKDFREGKPTKAAKEFAEFYRQMIGGDGRIAGWYDRKSGSVSLVKGKADAKTVAHEIGWHATYHWAEKNAPALYRKLKEYAKTATKSVKEAVRKRYGGDLSDDALLDEIGAERFTRDHMGAIEDALEKKKTESWWDGVEGACDETRVAFVERQTLTDSQIEKISKMEPKKAVEALVEAMLSGKMLGKKSVTSASKKYLEMAKRE